MAFANLILGTQNEPSCRGRSLYRTGISVMAMAASASAMAAETITYTYDAQGRVVRTQTSGSVNNGNASATTYDAANNRTHYGVGLAGAPVPPPPPPPPTAPPPPPPPPPANSPPVANTDSRTVQVCANGIVQVLANDTDPENNVPLTVQDAYPASSDIEVFGFSSTSVTVRGGFEVGARTVQYVVADSLGATSIGTINVTVTAGPACNLSAPADPPVSDDATNDGNGGSF